MAEQYAKLAVDGIEKKIELPVLNGTHGDSLIDISPLGKKGIYTFDPGFTSTAACESKITYIDGNQGKLLHRGYPIEQLSDKSSFIETCFLLINGELPKIKELEAFKNDISKHAFIEDELKNNIKSFNKNSHPMASLSTLISLLAGKYHNKNNIDSEKNRNKIICHLIAQLPILIAMIYRHNNGFDVIHPNKNHSYSESFLQMMFANTKHETKITKVVIEALDTIFLLHADHEQNASTSAVRLIGSTGANPYITIVGGLAALWGAAHGGANESVLNMFELIGNESNIDKYIKKAHDREDPFRLMGFGHRVYKNFDPRSKVMKEACHKILNELNLQDDPFLKIALKLEKIALEDPYFIDRKLYPNVDFYSGIILKAIGIPKNMLTTIFALGRTPGWLAQWNEMISEGYKLGRPRQLYTGYGSRDYVEIDKR